MRQAEWHTLLDQRLAGAVGLQMEMQQHHRNEMGASLIGLQLPFDRIHDAVADRRPPPACRLIPRGHAPAYVPLSSMAGSFRRPD
jgi:hypothetical protein